MCLLDTITCWHTTIEITFVKTFSNRIEIRNLNDLCTMSVEFTSYGNIFIHSDWCSLSALFWPSRGKASFHYYSYCNAMFGKHSSGLVYIVFRIPKGFYWKIYFPQLPVTFLQFFDFFLNFGKFTKRKRHFIIKNEVSDYWLQ